MRTGSRLTAVAATLLVAAPALAAQDDALSKVHWSTRPVASPVTPGTTVDVDFLGVIEKKWHVYSLTQPPGGPIALRISLRGDTQVVALAGRVTGPKHEVQPTSSFGIPVELYSDTARFTVPLRISPAAPASSVKATIAVRFQVCSDEICLPPRTTELAVPLTIGKGTPRTGRAR